MSCSIASEPCSIASRGSGRRAARCGLAATPPNLNLGTPFRNKGAVVVELELERGDVIATDA